MTRRSGSVGGLGGQPPGLPGPLADPTRPGDIHAFGDSNLYLQRTKEHLILFSEHRAAPAARARLSGVGCHRRGHDPSGSYRGP